MHPVHRIRLWKDGEGRYTQVMVEVLDHYNDPVGSAYQDIDTQYVQEALDLVPGLLDRLVRRYGHQLPLFP